MRLRNEDLMIGHGILRLYLPAMQVIIDCCAKGGEKPEEILIRWRASSCRHWFY